MSKGLEALEDLRFLESCKEEYAKEKINTIETALKALEIFKTKQIDIMALRISNSANEYNRIIKIFGSNITQEEYDLLKEVLL